MFQILDFGVQNNQSKHKNKFSSDFFFIKAKCTYPNQSGAMRKINFPLKIITNCASLVHKKCNNVLAMSLLHRCGEIF